MLRSLAKQSAIYGVSTIVGRLLSYLLTPYYTRMFAPAEYGVITDLYALIPFALVVLTFGMESSYFRFAARETNAEGKRGLYATTWGITSVLSLIFIAGVSLFTSPINTLSGALYRYSQLVLVVAWWLSAFQLSSLCSTTRRGAFGELCDAQIDQYCDSSSTRGRLWSGRVV